MVIGLVDADSHNFPNLPLMKISSWHKAQGDTVMWYTPDVYFDAVYVSKVFTESVDPLPMLAQNDNFAELYKGGSGYDLTNKLPYYIEHATPD